MFRERKFHEFFFRELQLVFWGRNSIVWSVCFWRKCLLWKTCEKSTSLRWRQPGNEIKKKVTMNFSVQQMRNVSIKTSLCSSFDIIKRSFSFLSRKKARKTKNSFPFVSSASPLYLKRFHLENVDKQSRVFVSTFQGSSFKIVQFFLIFFFYDESLEIAKKYSNNGNRPTCLSGEIMKIS